MRARTELAPRGCHRVCTLAVLKRQIRSMATGGGFHGSHQTSGPDRAEIGAATIEPSSFFTADVPSLTLRVQRGTSGAVHLPTNNTLPKEERILASRCPLRSRLDERHSGAEASGAAWYLREAEVLRALAMGQKTF